MELFVKTVLLELIPGTLKGNANSVVLTVQSVKLKTLVRPVNKDFTPTISNNARQYVETVKISLSPVMMGTKEIMMDVIQTARYSWVIAAQEEVLPKQILASSRLLRLHSMNLQN